MWLTPENYSIFAKSFFKNISGFTDELFIKIKSLYEEYNFMILITAGFTPIPFELFTINAGVFNINFLLFIIASTVSRRKHFFWLHF